MAELDFTAEKIEPRMGGDFPLIPGGKYAMIITDTEVKPTKAGNGEGIKMVYKITDGQFTNRLIFDWINIKNPSEKCVEIGKEQLSRICAAITLAGFKDTAELHNKPFTGVVRHQDGRNGEMEARVQDFLPAGKHDLESSDDGSSEEEIPF